MIIPFIVQIKMTSSWSSYR